MKKELLDEFIAFAKAEYGLTVEAVESDTPDSFEKIFGGSFSNNMETIELGSYSYGGKMSSELSMDMNSVYECSYSIKLDSAA